MEAGRRRESSLLILGLLAATIGLPYFLLSTTSPLVQVWFARRFPARSPYRLFALSNLASMLALLGYPLALEPWVATRVQSYGWSAAYVVFVLLVAASAWRSLRAEPALAATAQGAGQTTDTPPPLGAQLRWMALAATGSYLLLAVSNHICQNIASIPLLWIVPLSIYLLTFILCFDGEGWYRRETFLAVLAAALGVMAWTLADVDLTHRLALQIGVFCVGLFIACMFCHGELARLKPPPRYLTRFYLMVSLGGAIGSALVGLVAPLVLPAYFELAFGLVICAALLVLQTLRVHKVFVALAGASLLFAIGAGGWGIHDFYENTILATRNFYGVLRVQEYDQGTAVQHRSLIHGTILHGTQYLSPELERSATTYYTQSSGIGRAIESLHPSLRPLKVGIIGLGTGTIATYGSKGECIASTISILPWSHREARLHLPRPERGDHRDCIGRRTLEHGARATAGLRRARHRCLLQRRDTGAPDHHRGACRLLPPHEAGRHHCLPRDQPLSQGRTQNGRAHQPRRHSSRHRVFATRSRAF